MADNEATAEANSPRFGRAARMGTAAGAVLLLVALTAVLARTWIAAQVIAVALGMYGIGGASLSVTQLNSQSLTIEQFSAADGALTAERAVLRYTVPGLVRAKLDGVEITGLRIALKLDEKHLRLGSIDLLALGKTFTGGGASASPPVAAISVKDGSIDVATTRGAVHGTLDLSAAEKPGAWEMNFTTSGEGEGLTWNGTWNGRLTLAETPRLEGAGDISVAVAALAVPDITERLDLIAHFDIDSHGDAVVATNRGEVTLALGRLADAFARQMPAALAAIVTPGVRMAAPTVRLRYTLAGGAEAAVADASLNAEGLAATGVAADIQLDASFLPVPDAAQRVSAAALNYAGFALSQIVAEAARHRDGTFELRHFKAGLAGGRISSTSLTLPPPANSAVTLTFADLDLAALAAMIKPGGPEISGKLSGSIPAKFTVGGGAPNSPTVTALSITDGAIDVVTNRGTVHGIIDLNAAEKRGAWETNFKTSGTGDGLTWSGTWKGRLTSAKSPRLEGRGEIGVDMAALAIPGVTERLDLAARFALDGQGDALLVTNRGDVTLASDALATAFVRRLPAALGDILAPGVRATVPTVRLRYTLAGGAEVAIAGASVNAETLAATGVAAAVHLDSSFLPASDAAQSLSAATLTYADFVFSQIAAAGAKKRDGTYEIQRLEAGLAGGFISSTSVTIPPPVDSAVTLTFTDLDLALIAAMIKPDGLDISGKLSGSVPAKISADGVRLEEGALKTSAPGHVRYRPKTPPASLAASESGQLVLKALSNFAYDTIALSANGDAGKEMEVLVSLAGRNPDLYGGYPIVLNVNLSGELGQLLQQGLSQAKLPADAVRRLRENTPAK